MSDKLCQEQQERKVRLGYIT